MERKREYYYKTPSASDYTYSDYLEYCHDMDIPDDEIAPDESSEFYEWCDNRIDWDDECSNVPYQFAEMVRDIIGDKDMDIDDVLDMYFYIKSNAVGWRRASAHSKPIKVKDALDLMRNAYDYIEIYRELFDDNVWSYTVMLAGHDSTDYFDIVPFHEDFIVNIMDDMKDYLGIDDIISYISYYDFKNVKNMIAMVKNIGKYNKEDMEVVINYLVDGKENDMLMNLLHKGE